MLQIRRYYHGLWVAALLLSGCGPYEARLQETIARGGRPGAAPTGAANPAQVQIDATKNHNAPYPIYPAGSTTASGVTIYLPKEYVVNGQAASANSAALGTVPIIPAGAEMASVMSLYYDDVNTRKKFPTIIAFCRLPNNKAADAAARTAAEAALIASLGANPPPTFVDFPTPSGNWRKLTYYPSLNLPAGDANGVAEAVPSRVDLYVQMTTNEELRIQIIAPNSVVNAFDFFGEAEAGLKAMTATTPAKTGTVP
jgi:hypothetical protein